MCGSWRNCPLVPWVSGGSSVGARGAALTCCVAFIVLPELCTLTLLYCAAFIQIVLSNSQENTNSEMSGVFGGGTPQLWSHNVTNITAALCLDRKSVV